MSNTFYSDSTPLASTATVAAATATATLSSATGRIAYISGFVVSGLGATAAASSAVTITGILGGTQTYQFSVPAGVTAVATPMVVNFTMPIPASATNTNIVVSAASFGSGNTNANVTAYGFLK